MTRSGSTPMGSHSFQSIEEIDANEGLTDFDIFDTHVHNEPRVDDVCDLSQCDDEVRTPRENEGCENFDNFDSQLIDGKTFDTLEAAYDFYNQYALLNGFGTRKHNAHKIRATGAIFRRQFVCNKEGFKKLDDKRPNVNEKRRRDLRTGCEAMIQVTLSKKLGVWVVDKFQDVHNHPLTTTPSNVIKHRSHSKYHRTNVCKSLVSDLNHEGLKASQITRVVNVMKPSEEADVTPRQSHSNWTKSQSIKDFEARWVDLNDMYAKEDEDFKTMNSRAVLSSDHPIEARAGACYTRSLFEIFKKEWNASVSYLHITLSKEPGVTRWTIHARYKVGDIGDREDEISSHSTEKGVSLLTLWYVRAKFSRAIDNGRNCPSEIREIDAWLNSLLEKQAARNSMEKLVSDKMVSQVGSSTNVSQIESMHQISIRDPAAPIKTKWRPKVATRLKYSIELAKEEKKQRTCAYCHGKGHYRTGCAKRKDTSLDYIRSTHFGLAKAVGRDLC
ncbi:hypothetical protein RJ640_013528 [Escallonia rubra]|uniref:FAR1 domain-containing protein n=1 Tax=Escallonia rubra TaxID=112253 RepID=A0AA88RHW2_9ASTE|nr:hypothetical protein RJ640_013528 [Escallonia rubra]